MAGAGGVGIGLFGAVTGVAWLGAVVPVAGLVRNGTRTVTQAEPLRKKISLQYKRYA